MGLPKDTIVIHGNRIFINSEAIFQKQVYQNEHYNVIEEHLGNKHYNVKINRAKQTNIKRQWIVPAGMMFVLGDFRTKSMDSRVWGVIPLTAVMGTLVLK